MCQKESLNQEQTGKEQHDVIAPGGERGTVQTKESKKAKNKCEK